jgi:hypothetical protein
VAGTGVLKLDTSIDALGEGSERMWLERQANAYESILGPRRYHKGTCCNRGTLLQHLCPRFGCIRAHFSCGMHSASGQQHRARSYRLQVAANTGPRQRRLMQATDYKK